MKAVNGNVSPAMIEERRRKGLDHRDELWKGVYHMVPPPTGEHQEIVDELFVLFSPYADRQRLGKLRSNVGVRDEAQDYRIPEWVLLRSDRVHLFRPDSGYVDEAPDVILEVRSPGDETGEKIPFYEKVGVRELLLVDRDTRHVQVLRPVAGRLTPVSPNAEGWIYSEGLRAFFRTGERDGKPVLRVLLEIEKTEHLV